MRIVLMIVFFLISWFSFSSARNDQVKIAEASNSEGLDEIGYEQLVSKLGATEDERVKFLRLYLIRPFIVHGVIDHENLNQEVLLQLLGTSEEEQSKRLRVILKDQDKVRDYKESMILSYIFSVITLLLALMLGLSHYFSSKYRSR